MFSRRTLLYAVAALACFALAVTAGKGGKPKPPPDPPPAADPAILYIQRGHFPDYSLWVMDADGANKAEIVSVPDVAVRDADWSPDNTQLVLQLEDTTQHVWGFYLCDADGANLQRILHNWWTGSFGSPQWVHFSNGDDRIVYYPQDVQSNLPGQTSGIWSMKIDGTGHCEMMPEDPDQDGRRVAADHVSRDGSLIAFTYDRLGQYRHVALGTVAIDGAGCPVVVQTVELTEVDSSPLQGSDAWSAAIDPTGTMVAVSAGQVTDAGLWIIPIADPTSAWHVPVPNAGSWIPEGASWLDARTVVYHRYSGKKHEIFKADIYLGQETKLASASGRTSLMAPKAKN